MLNYQRVGVLAMNHRYEMGKYCDIIAKWRNMMLLLKLTIHSVIEIDYMDQQLRVYDEHHVNFVG